MSLTPRLTLIGLYKYNNSLFSNLTLPESIDKETFIDSLLLEYGECPLIYPDLDFMLLAIGAWSRKWYANFERIAAAITATYNPLHNYDRTENYTENLAGNSGEDSEYTRNVDTNFAGDSTTENQVSAYNESTYQPKDKEINDFSNDTDTDESYDSSTTKNETRSTQRSIRAFGNIGVTENTTMLKHELELRSTENLYHILSEIFYREFCIYVF